MYIPNMFREQDQDRIIEFMRANYFALVISSGNGAPVATHLPLTLVQAGDRLTLRGHFAKANPHALTLVHGETLVVFSGPHAYVSPSLYDKWESVPTWNYLAVHAYCSARLIHDPIRTEEILDELIGASEPDYQGRWDGLSERYRHGMMQGIVAFELDVLRIEAKAKLSQNKTREEQIRIAEWLSSSADPMARATGEEMARRLAAAPVDTITGTM